MWLNAFQLGTHPPGLGHILFDSTIQSIPSDPEKTKLCLDFPDPVSQSRLADLHPRVPFRMKETVIYSKSDINIPTRFLKWWMNLPTKYSVDQSSQKKNTKNIGLFLDIRRLVVIFTKSQGIFFGSPTYWQQPCRLQSALSAQQTWPGV